MCDMSVNNTAQILIIDRAVFGEAVSHCIAQHKSIGMVTNPFGSNAQYTLGYSVLFGAL